MLLTIPHPSATNHNGGKLAFGPDGYLYVGTGDGGGGNDPPNNAQNFGVAARQDPAHRRRTSRRRPTTRSPPATPSPPAPATARTVPAGTCPEIWSLGWRNPWRWSFDRLTGDLFVGDVGQGAREEIDFEPRGTPGARNYGWRILEGTICTPGVESELHAAAELRAADRRLRPQPPARRSPAAFATAATRIAPLTRRVRVRRLRQRTDLGGDATRAAARGPAQQPLLQTSGVSAFGEDATGELYVANYFNGTVSRLDPADSDGDGLPDWWELAWFGSATAAAGERGRRRRRRDEPRRVACRHPPARCAGRACGAALRRPGDHQSQRAHLRGRQRVLAAPHDDRHARAVAGAHRHVAGAGSPTTRRRARSRGRPRPGPRACTCRT